MSAPRRRPAPLYVGAHPGHRSRRAPRVDGFEDMSPTDIIATLLGFAEHRERLGRFVEKKSAELHVHLVTMDRGEEFARKLMVGLRAALHMGAAYAVAALSECTHAADCPHCHPEATCPGILPPGVTLQ